MVQKIWFVMPPRFWFLHHEIRLCPRLDRRPRNTPPDGCLKHAKCARVYQEKASGAKTEPPELLKLLDTARKGDVTIVWKLDRLAR